MRLSRPDETDPTKQRHFEISIDSPFKILSCRATAANTSLPVYTSGNMPVSPLNEFGCGCPGAARHRRNPSPGHGACSAINACTSNVDALLSARSWTNNSAGLTAPRSAHIHDPSSGVQGPKPGNSRPTNLLRAPSVNPPPFSDEPPPPPLMTPPPNYENAVSGDSSHALADYFSRLADEMGDDDQSGARGRVDLPLTPGGRVNRSMDARRAWVPLDATVAR
jgi:arrestin-related trafficking adapter 3/6